jgi:alginate O-acetyltransferase complex protein AlgI
MLFDRPIYFLFLTLVVLLYWRLPWRGQNVLLLIASYFFYGWWDGRFLALMAGSTVVDYALATRIDRSQAVAARRAYLVVSLLMNFGFLGLFKYFNFFVDSVQHVTRVFGAQDLPVTLLRIILPPGISFYTFQAVAYIVDVYQKRMKPAQSLIDYALFISLFPHLIAGPIQRPSHLLPQVQTPRELKHEEVFDGLMLIVTGLFRKCVIADNCALLANAVFNGSFGAPTLPVVLLGVYAFAWQIYGDFSGYSDIARGSAQLLGFHFMVNFRQPYLATSLRDFWRRWHISLSTWLRDYLYIPLGGNRRGEGRTYANLFTTMLLGGLWHGANWTFVVWGALHGMGLAVKRWLGGMSLRSRSWLLAPGSWLRRDNDRTASRWAGIPTRSQEPGARSRLTSPSPVRIWVARIVLFHVVCFGWLFFRANSVGNAFSLLAGLGRLAWRPEYLTAIQFLAWFSAPLLLLDLRMERAGEEYPFEKAAHGYEQASYRRRIALATGALFLIALFAASQPNAFIYFQF